MVLNWLDKVVCLSFCHIKIDTRMAQHEKKASSSTSIKEVGNKMKRKILRILFINGTTQIVIPAIFIILVTSLSLLCLKVNVIRGSCFIFIISSVIVCVNLYNRSAFWNQYWKILKIPLCCFFVVCNILGTFLMIIFIPIFLFVCFSFIIYYCFKYGYPLIIQEDIPDGLLLYLTITISFIYVTLKSSEDRFNKGYLRARIQSEEAEKKRASKLESKQGIFTQLFNEVSNELNKPLILYSSDITRYVIYSFYFLLIIYSYTAQFLYTEDWIKELIDNKAINSSLLTYLAFDNLYRDRHLVKSVSLKNTMAVAKMAATNIQNIFYKDKR